MKLAVISDIHDNEANLKKFFDWCRQAGAGGIVCCGDVTNARTLDLLSSGFKGLIHLVRGNADSFTDADAASRPNIRFYGRSGRFECGGRRIGFCHEPFLVPDIRKGDPCDLIFYGHTHKPWVDELGGSIIANPGTLAGMFIEATFAVCDTADGSLSLKILNDILG